MIKRQLNPLRIGKGLLCLLALFMMLLTPQGAWAEDYALTIAGHGYTASDLLNAQTVTGDGISGTVTITPASGTDPVKLTLSSATLGNESLDGSITTSVNLLVDFIGSNVIKLTDNGGYAFYGNGTPTLSFSNTGKNGYPLYVRGSFDAGYSNFMSGFSQTSVNIDWDNQPAETSIWRMYNGSSYEMCLLWYQKYDLWIGEQQFSTTETELSGGVASFDGDHTLTLNGISGVSGITTKIDNLIISLRGDNSIVGSIQYIGTSETASLTFNADLENANSASLTLSTESQEIGVINGFNTVTVNAPLVTNVTEWNDDVKNATIKVQSYDISVGGVMVTSANAANITGNYITGTVTFDAENNTLTLNNATIDLSSFEGPGIKYTGTENFTIKLIGTNSVKANYNSEPIIYDVYPAPTQIPTLTFESGSFPCSLSLQGVNSSVIKYFGDVLGVNGINNAEGNYLTISESGVKYNSTNGLYTGDNTAVTSVTISSVSLESVAPTINRMAMQDGDGIKLILSSGINNGTIKYSVDYVDENETDITDATYDDTNRPTISKPATVTAYISVNNETSATATAKYFGFTEPMTVVYEGTPVELTNLPTLVPATEGLTYEIGEISNAAIISYDEQTEKYRAVGCGTAILTVNIPEHVDPLNDGCETTLTVNVVPPAPTIGLDEGEVLNTATITLTTTINGATIKYKWDNGTEETYSEAIPVQAGTLKAWVEVSSVVSDVVEATYSLITDISTLYFAAIDDIPYTGSAVTPTIVVKETEDAETPLTLGTDYTVSYKKEETSITAADLVNRGNYTVVISGTGNYGGTKELKFSITTGIATITAENQTAEYTGDQIEFDKNAITLTPNTLSKDGLSFNYYTPNSDNPEEPNMLEEAPTNVGTYIVEISFEDDNYAAEPVTKTLTISAKSITSDMITLYESSFEYNGEKQVPTVTVKDGEVTLVGDDYDVSFELVIEDEDPIAIEDENAIIDVATYNVVVTGKGNYTSSATKAFAITKASLPVGGENGLKVTLAGWKYGAEANTPSVSGNLGNGDVTYTYKDAEDENAEFSTTVPTNVGSYIIKATVAETANYLGGEAVNEFLIAKGDLTMVSASVPEELIYDGTEKQLITVANVPEGATAKYYWSAITENEFKNGDYDLVCDPEDNIFTNPVPKATNAGYYAIIYKVFGGDNYNDKLASQTMKVAIYPATITELTINPTSMAYTGAAQTVTITSVKAGDLVLTANDYTVTLNDVALTGNIQATAVGEYTVTVTGQGNYTGTESATFSIVNRTLADNEVTFYNNWATYYSAVGDVMLPEGIGAFIVLESGIGENTVTVTPINYVPEKVAVLLSNDDKVVTQTDNTSAAGNMLRHADEDVDADDFEGLIYGLHNGTFMRVTGIIPADKNYLVAWEAQAPQLTIVFEGETTGVNDVRSKTAETGADFYDMQGRKVQKPSKKGLYISNGRKVVVK